jgi:hypothetical protein
MLTKKCIINIKLLNDSLICRMTSSVSVEDLCKYLKRKYKLSNKALSSTCGTMKSYFDRKKDFDVLVDKTKGTVVLVAKKTPNTTPSFSEL